MAIAVASVTTPSFAGYNSAGTFTLTHPSGLAAGDLMIAVILAVDADNGVTPDIHLEAPPSGWTYLTNTSGSLGQIIAYSKVATSGDVSAGSTVFSLGIGGTDDLWAAGSIFRITGQGGEASIQYNAGTSSGTSPSFAITVTPSFADSLLLLLVGQLNNASTSTSAYAIATDNPSWSEQFDVYGDSSGYTGVGRDATIAAASAVRSQVTATGNSTCTFSQTGNSLAILLVIPPVSNASVSPAVIPMTASVQAPTISGAANVSPSVVTMAASVQAPTVSVAASDWANIAKSSAIDPVNISKS